MYWTLGDEPPLTVSWCCGTGITKGSSLNSSSLVEMDAMASLNLLLLIVTID